MPGVPAVAHPSVAGLRTFPQTLVATSAIPPNWCRAQVGFAEMEIPDAATRARIGFAEVEVPNAARRALLGFAEMQVPDAARRALLGFGEMEIPDVPIGGVDLDGRLVAAATFDRVGRHA